MALRTPESSSTTMTRGFFFMRRFPPRPAAARKSRRRAGSTGRVPIVPPCACTMVRLMARPRPVPDPLVVQKGSNSRSAIDGSMPGPLSVTRISISPSPFALRRDLDLARRRRGFARSASRALRTRLSTTCCSWTALPMTRGRSRARAPCAAARRARVRRRSAANGVPRRSALTSSAARSSRRIGAHHLPQPPDDLAGAQSFGVDLAHRLAQLRRDPVAACSR